MPVNVKEGSFGLFYHSICCKISNNSKGPLVTLLNFRQKSHTEPEKNERGDPIDSFDFVCYVKMEKKREDFLCKLRRSSSLEVLKK